jgi:hypothetical protein
MRLGHTERYWSEVALFRATVVYLWCGVALFLLLSPPTIFSADSFSYKDRTHRNLEMAWLSLQGKWNRSPTIVVPFALLGSDTTIEYGQTFLLGLAFTFLVLTVYRIESIGTVTKAVIGFLLTTMVLAPAMLSWNLQIASESLSVSYAVIAFTASLRFLLRWEPKWLLLSSVAAMFAISAKATLGFVFVPLIAAELVVFSRRVLVQREKRGRDPSRPSVLHLLLVGISVCAIIGTGILYVSMQDQASLNKGIGKEKDAIVHLISVEDPINASIRRSLQATDIPRCVPLDRAVQYSKISSLEFRLTRSCPALTSWSVHKYPTWYAEFLLSHPDKVRKLLADILPYSFTYTLREQGVFAVLSPVSDIIWGTYRVPTAQVHAATFELPPLGFEDLVYPAVLAVNGAGIWLLLARRRRRQVGAQRLRLFWCCLFTIDAAVLVIVTQVLFLTNTGLGAERIALEANVLIRISLLLAFGLAIPWLWAQWRSRTGSTDGTSPPLADRDLNPSRP